MIPEEVGFKVLFVPANLDSPKVILTKTSTIWTNDSASQEYKSTTLYNYYSVDITNRDSQNVLFRIYNEDKMSDPYPIGWGKYELKLQYYQYNEILDDWDTLLYGNLLLDFTDAGWPYDSVYHSQYGHADIFIRFTWNDVENPDQDFYYRRSNGTSWNQAVDNSTLKIWETNADTINYPDYVPNTQVFVPEKPKNFSVGSNSGNPQLSWTSNGESFPVKYFIYRRLFTKYGTYALFDSTTSTSYIDDNLDGAGSSGYYHAYYFVKTKNISTGSALVSSPTDTIEIHWSYYGYDKKGADPLLKSAALNPNYPNPFNPSTEITYQIPIEDYVTLKIYNTLGQEVRTLVNENQTAGLHTIIWNGKNGFGQTVPSGIYLYRLQTKTYTKTMKMLFVK